VDRQLSYAAAFVNKASVNMASRSLEAVVSDETIDRHGDIIDQASWQLARYADNPVVLHQHNHSKPCGRAESVRVESSKLLAKITFARTPLGDEMLALYREGALSAFSVGFRVGRIVPERLQDGRTIDRLMDCELYEISAVSVPSNPNALIRHKSLGLVPAGHADVSPGEWIHQEAMRRASMTDEQRTKEDVDSLFNDMLAGHR